MPSQAGHPSAKSVFGFAARYGSQAIPTLRQLSKTNQELEQTGGAAQAALAKLGDETALRELQDELTDRNRTDKDWAIWKLQYVGTSKAILILADFLLNDNCRSCETYDDVGYDPRVQAQKALLRIMVDPPVQGEFSATLDLPRWKRWWDDHKNDFRQPTAEEQVSDSRLKCLARWAQWNDSLALDLLAQEGGQEIVPVLKYFSLLGSKEHVGDFYSVAGRAQTILAKLGDQAHFDSIVRQLRSVEYGDALTKLRYIGSREAADAITSNINDVEYLHGYGYPSLAEEADAHRNNLLAVLVDMVRNAPLARRDRYTDDDVVLWGNWWARNRNSAEIIPLKVSEH